MGLKIAVIGGGSTYTPELVQGLADRTQSLPVDEVALHDIDGERLAIVAGLCERILRRQDWPGRLTTTTDRDPAIDGADFVLVQLRIGGQAARFSDETLPHRFGCIGQETTGPGGFAKALRTVPVVLDLAGEVARRSAPGAWIVDFTNPVGIVTQALLDAGHRAIGLCNVAIGFQRWMAARFGVTPDRVELEHVGLNHLTWVRAIRVDGVDRLPELIDEHAGRSWRTRRRPAGRAHPGAPGDALLLPPLLLRDPGGPRGAAGRPDPRRGRHGDRARAARALPRPDPRSEAGAPRVARRRLLQRGRRPADGLAPCRDRRRPGRRRPERRGAGRSPAVGGRGGARPDRSRRGPPGAARPARARAPGLVQRAKAYEELAIEAALTGDQRIALLALLANPLVPDLRAAEGLLEAILEVNGRFLPRFATPA